VRELAINAGIVKIIFRGDYPDELAMELLQEAGVRVVRYEPGAP
jgi:dCMP deaminase